MATMTFGVHLLPKTTNTYTLGNSDQKWKIYATELNGTNMDNYVTIAGNQALTNKTYNGFSLAGACAKAVDSSISNTTSVNLPTSAAVANYVNDTRIEIWDLT